MARFHKRALPDGTIERIPFTPEEEAQRDAEEAAWEVERPLRLAKIDREAQREARIKVLASKQTVTRAESDEFMNLLRERELG